ncbi:hypothetical protein [Rhodopseudomonas palustris]|uniref:Uncharacterized protein n=1 Tax=Rhodopseudomonas palustris (strain ATCC BAA-98 / CGA009) TaxID=258594 RepID=A0AAE9XYS0_RHOPA|nr:hypothetical protein [Rhodopseudomonas palustris]WAB79815.1 hypothetical protein OR798_11155 [Rhodopseudomonas palustris]WCL92315.1 hypothetical protein TX73_011150 [Rhodopseudomonas palustris CGA009]WND53706.1 hypothetical protein L1A21_11110 [Rhodopseudomonas palustris]
MIPGSTAHERTKAHDTRRASLSERRQRISKAATIAQHRFTQRQIMRRLRQTSTQIRRRPLRQSVAVGILLRDGTRPIKQKGTFKKNRSLGAKIAVRNKIISEALHSAFARCTKASPIVAQIEGLDV